MSQESILKNVQQTYASVAAGKLNNESEAARAVAQAFGYTAEDLASLPVQANMGLSCGNPVAIAGLREGEVVVDLGCGGGLDVILAAKRVEPTGKAIGIDMTPEMLERARVGAIQVGAANTEFHLAKIDQLPLADQSVDCVISNCVINLVPDKSAVFREILRVLKPGGRLVVSDIALKQALPADIANDMQAHVGCIAGALLISEYESQLRKAGFEAVVVQDTGRDLNVYSQSGAMSCCGSDSNCASSSQPQAMSAVHDGLSNVLSRFDANQYAASVRVHALKASETNSLSEQILRPTMAIQIFDKPMCCSTGVCGPQVDPVLAQFAADLDWLKTQGIEVTRFNLAHEPQAFINNELVQTELSTRGVDVLPLIIVNGELKSAQVYPNRQQLANFASLKVKTATPLPMLNNSSCCGSSDCC